MSLTKCHTIVAWNEFWKDGVLVNTQPVRCKNIGKKKTGMCNSHMQKSRVTYLRATIHKLCECGLVIGGSRYIRQLTEYDYKTGKIITREKGQLTPSEIELMDTSKCCSQCNAKKTALRDEICMFRLYSMNEDGYNWHYKTDFCRKPWKKGETRCEEHVNMTSLIE